MYRIIISGAVTVLVLYLGACLATYLAQRSLLYLPTRDGPFAPGSAIQLTVPGAALQVSVRNAEGPDALIYFGGNAEAVAGNMALLSPAFPGHALYLMHYRGYDGSTGVPTEADLHADAQALYALVRSRHPDITVVGRSLGSGIAVRLAAGNEVKRLVLVTPYDSIVNVAKKAFPWLPVGVLLKDRFESVRYAPQILSPTTIIMAENDEVIPRAGTVRLFQAFRPGVATLNVIENAGHNTISEFPEYTALLRGNP